VTASQPVRRATAEALGTFFIAMVYALGHLSGAHINPAVTVAFWSVRRFPSAPVLPYVATQTAGALAASWALRAALGPVGDLGATLPRIPIRHHGCSHR
jgi:aquaporin Z